VLLRRALVALHDNEFGADEGVVEHRHDRRHRARARAAEADVAGFCVVDRSDAGLVPGRRHHVRARQRGEPAEVAERILQARPAGRLEHQQAVAHDVHHRAVLRRDAGHIIGGGEAARARHVHDHEARIAGDVLAEMPRQHPRIGIVVVAGAAEGDDGDLLAGVEMILRVARFGLRDADGDADGAGHDDCFHGCLP
jgi:hypothetical protein